MCLCSQNHIFQIKDTYFLSSSMEAIVYCWMTAASTPIQGRSGVCCSGWAAKHTNDRVKTANMDGGAVWLAVMRGDVAMTEVRQRPEPPGVCTSGETSNRGN